MVSRPASLTKRLIATAVALVLGAAAVVGVTNALAHGKSRHRIATTVEGTHEAEVGIILGAEIYPDGTPSPFLAGRLEVGAALLEAGKVKRLIVSGDGSSDHYDEPTGMKAWLVNQLGVPADRITVDLHGDDTYDSCYRARHVYGVTSAVMVSQTFHLPRAVATCRMVGIDAWGSGDESARRFAGTWRHGEQREVVACVKMGWDLLIRRKPHLGE